jgi:tetratricopeptide (TPR) repeat protein
MKKQLLTWGSFLCLALPAMAQKTNVTNAWMHLKHNELGEAMSAIDQASTNIETKDDPKTWLYRGNVYNAISYSKDDKFKTLSSNPEGEAIKSWVNTVKLDSRGKYPEAYDSLNSVALRSYNSAVNLYQQKSYEKALIYFTNFFDAYSGLGERKKGIDQILEKIQLKTNDIRLFMAGAAQGANKTELARNIYEELVKSKYEEPSIYTDLARVYKAEGDTQKALDVLEDGINTLQKDKAPLLEEQLDTYIKMGQNEKAVELGKHAIEADPKNTSVYVAIGNVYDFKLKKYTEAQDMYKKALEIDTAYYPAYAHLGFSYFNQGADIYNSSLKEKDMNKSINLEKQAKSIWQQAIPYLEKANKLKAGNNDILDTLARVYAQLGDQKKSEAYRAQMKK